MKRLMVVALFLCLALPAMAKTNSVDVAGDIVKDGKYTIDVDWTFDSAKYPGLSREAMRDKVRQDIKAQVISKVTQALQNSGISVDQSNFAVIKETTEVVQTRADGSKLYSIDMQIEFASTAPVASAKPAPAKKPRYEDALNQRWDSDI